MRKDDDLLDAGNMVLHMMHKKPLEMHLIVATDTCYNKPTAIILTKRLKFLVRALTWNSTRPSSPFYDRIHIVDSSQMAI